MTSCVVQILPTPIPQRKPSHPAWIKCAACRNENVQHACQRNLLDALDQVCVREGAAAYELSLIRYLQ